MPLRGGAPGRRGWWSPPPPGRAREGCAPLGGGRRHHQCRCHHRWQPTRWTPPPPPAVPPRAPSLPWRPRREGGGTQQRAFQRGRGGQTMVTAAGACVRRGAHPQRGADGRHGRDSGVSRGSAGALSSNLAGPCAPEHDRRAGTAGASVSPSLPPPSSESSTAAHKATGPPHMRDVRPSTSALLARRRRSRRPHAHPRADPPRDGCPPLERLKKRLGYFFSVKSFKFKSYV